jgi:hypothetical protein
MRRVEIEWLDSSTVPSDSWLTGEQMEAIVDEPVVVHTVGMLYKVELDFIVVMNSASSAGYYWGAIVILKKSIIKARELK